jgi:quercetin dioxygenase-like cupin family protein
MQTDDVIDNGTESMRFRRNDGDALEIEALYRPRAPRPPAGYHPAQEELVEVVRGKVAIVMSGQKHILGAGESLLIPRGTPHHLACSGDEEAQVILTLRPALETEAFFREVFRLSREGKLRPGVGGVLRFAVIARRYRREFVLAKPPRWVQTAAFSLLAPLGRALGGA